MKKYIIFLLALPLLFSSCLKEDNDVFGKLAGERLSEAQIRLHGILKDAPNGWVMNYYPGRSLQYGGFMAYMLFDGNETVKISSEISMWDGTKTPAQGAAEFEESLYDLKGDYGLTLNLVTYNDFFSIFSEPGTGFGADKNIGLGGDGEFIVVNAEPNRILLRGKKAGYDVVMTPLPVGKTWEQSLEEYYQKATVMDAMPSYKFELGGATYAMDRYSEILIWRNFQIYAAADQIIDAPYHYTLTGIQFRDPLNIDGVEITEMEWNGSGYEDVKSGAKITPITSQNTFTVSASNIQANSATVSVTPTIGTEYYYSGAYLKSDEDTKTDAEIIKGIVASLKTADLRKGTSSRSVRVKEQTQYVPYAFGAYVSPGGRVAATTNMKKGPVFTTPVDVPPTEAYKAWLGTWTVTSTSSAKNKTGYSLDIVIGEDVRNSSYSILGWDISAYRSQFPVIATLSSGKLVIANGQSVGTTSDGTVKYVGYCWVPSDKDYFIVGGGYPGLTCTLNADKSSASVLGYSGELSDGSTFTVESMIQAVYNGDTLLGTYNPASGSGFTAGDYQTGTLTMVKKSASGVAPMQAPMAAPIFMVDMSRYTRSSK